MLFWLSEPGANLLFSIVQKFEGEDIRDSMGKLYHSQLWRLDQPAEFIDQTDGFIDHTGGFIDQATGAHIDLTSGTTNLPGRTICHKSPLSPAATPFRGIIRGTSPVGHLLVELPDGTTREFTFKEIAYIL